MHAMPKRSQFETTLNTPWWGEDVLRFVGLILPVIGLLLLALDPASAATLYVPDQYATIQAAINVAEDGDTIELTDSVGGDFTVPVDLLDVEVRAQDRAITSYGTTTVYGGARFENMTLDGPTVVEQGAEFASFSDCILSFSRFGGFTAEDGTISFARCYISGDGPGIWIEGAARLSMWWTRVSGVHYGVTITNTGFGAEVISASLISNCVFGGINLNNANLNLVHTTIAGNGQYAISATFMDNQQVEMINSIITAEGWQNAAELEGPMARVIARRSVIHGNLRGLEGVQEFAGRPLRGDPLLTADYHLSADSPARGLGWNTGGEVLFDLDGVWYANPPSAGCYEYVEE